MWQIFDAAMVRAVSGGFESMKMNLLTRLPAEERFRPFSETAIDTVHQKLNTA